MSATTSPSALLEPVWIEVPAGRIEPDVDHYHVLDLHAGKTVGTSIRLDGQEYRGPTRYGDINTIPAGCSGRWLFESRANALLLRLAPGLIEEVGDAMRVPLADFELRPALCQRDPHIEHLGWMLNDERRAGYPCGRLWLESAAYAIVLRLLKRAQTSARLPRLMSRALPKWRLQRVCEYIEANLDQDLSLRELAAIAGFSVPHFKVLFRHSTGMPAHRYVVEQRVEHARQLILRGEHSMTDIALDAGFAHQSHMARCVQRVLGIGPTQVAELYLGNDTGRGEPGGLEAACQKSNS